MWHESRKQERLVRGMLIDYQKRAERRKDHYEKLKTDPLQLLRVTGSPSKLHLNASASRNEYSNLVPWQGDSSVIISRFDVRAHLDHISESTSSEGIQDSKTEPDCDYERYRQLVYNSFTGVSQENALEGINIDEMYPVNKPIHTEKKSSANKVAIGYQYDSNVPTENSSTLQQQEPESEHSSADDQLSDIGSNLNLNELDRKQIDTLNGIGNEYGISPGRFTSYVKNDAIEQKQAKEDLFLEKQKAIQKSKVGTRRERRANRLGAKSRQPERVFSRNSPLSFACRQSPTYSLPYRDRSASSSEGESGNIEYITEFGTVSHPQSKERSKSRHRAKRPRLHRSRSRSRSHSSRHRRSRSRSRSRDRHRHSYRRRERRNSSSSRSRSRSPSNIRHYSHSRRPRERRRSSDSSNSSPSTGRESDKRPSEISSIPTIKKTTEKLSDKPKLTHFEKMQLKMENKITKHLKQDHKMERVKVRAKEAEQEDREDDMREQVLKWRRREREREFADEEYPY